MAAKSSIPCGRLGSANEEEHLPDIILKRSEWSGVNPFIVFIGISISYCLAPSIASRVSILRVWDIVNTHYESLLATAQRSDTKEKAEINIRSQVKELRELMETCSRRLKTIEVYISELQEQETIGGLTSSLSQHTPSSELAGEWHFLYMEDNSVFGYMKLVPETVSVTSENCHSDSTSVKSAEFTIPPGVLREANETGDYTQLADQCQDYTLCPCCERSVKASEFWKHALFEIAERGNRVPAWQSLDRSETPRWIVRESSGWCKPIYRPRCLERTCEIGHRVSQS